MELSELRLFLAATRHPSLHAAAQELNLTPSALSKAIRRLEEGLRTPLFDRVGRGMQLNAAGQRLRERALALLGLAEQTRAEFEGADFKVCCRVAAPALLQWRWAGELARALATRHADSSLVFRPAYEDEALAVLQRGEADFALVTEQALEHSAGSPLTCRPMGELTMQLAAGPSHPLVRGAQRTRQRVRARDVLLHDFACPSRSMFCGLPRGTRSDGWRDDVLPRRIRFWVDDVQVLLSLVQSGQALAYLPEFALREARLVHVQVTDCPFSCTERALLAWRPGASPSWQAALVDALGPAPAH